jgi:flagellar assembly protein FliH
MSATRKFLFDVSFDKSLAEEAALAAAAKASEVAAAREAAYAEGRAAALAEAAASREQSVAATLDRVSSTLAELFAAHAETAAALERQALGLVVEMGRRIVPDLARRNGLNEIAALLAQCLREALDEPRIVLRVADNEFEGIRERIAGISEQAGYAGKVVIFADETLASGDCRVEWADGGAERDTARGWHDIEAAVARSLDQSARAETHRGEQG